MRRPLCLFWLPAGIWEIVGQHSLINIGREGQ